MFSHRASRTDVNIPSSGEKLGGQKETVKKFVGGVDDEEEGNLARGRASSSERGCRGREPGTSGPLPDQQGAL